MRKFIIGGFCILIGMKCFASNYLPKPEELVEFKKGSVACMTSDSLQELFDHLNNKEDTLAQEMLDDMRCINMSPGYGWKVLKTKYSWATHIIYVESTYNESLKLWTYAEYVQPYKHDKNNEK